MKKNKKNNLLFIAVMASTFVLGNTAWACNSGSCVSSCATGFVPTGESCTVSAADLSMPGVCCVPTSSVTTAPPAPSPTTTTPSGNSGGVYTNQEKIPGAQPTSDFVQYMKDIINFLFVALGILALLMLVIGAYQYLIASGTGNVSDAKETIASALLGLILGMCAWIILNKINPDLVNMRPITQITGNGGAGGTGGSGGGTGGGTPTTGGPTGNGSCDPEQGSCQSANLSCFGPGANAASQICGYESAGGNPMAKSKTDITVDGQEFSIGLFQLNLTQHDLGMGCTSAFSGKNKNATVVNQDLYNRCVTKAQDPAYNINYACQLYKGRGNFGDWSNTVKHCGL